MIKCKKNIQRLWDFSEVCNENLEETLEIEKNVANDMNEISLDADGIEISKEIEDIFERRMKESHKKPWYSTLEFNKR